MGSYMDVTKPQKWVGGVLAWEWVLSAKQYITCIRVIPYLLTRNYVPPILLIRFSYKYRGAHKLNNVGLFI